VIAYVVILEKGGNRKKVERWKKVVLLMFDIWLSN